ncbi:MAG: HAD family phosphatase [Actinomycetaceae bacterium]|nr:HAD family phosphatase [Actinomycetaceae bacterium]
MKAVIFDFGNVLVDWDPYLAVAHLMTRQQWDEFVDEANFELFLQRTDAGADFDEELQRLARRSPQWGWIVPEYYRCFAATIAGEIPYMETLITQIKDAGIHCYGLTNWPAATVAFSAGVPGVRLMEDVVVSGYERIAKPDHEIYRRALQRFGLNAAEAVFIDDKPENVQAAKEVGMDGFVFYDAVDAANQLRARGLPLRFGMHNH